METIWTVLFVLYWLAVLGLFAYGVNCYVLLFCFHRGKNHHLRRLQEVREEFARRTDDDALPVVTVQLPVFNERYVVERLIRSVAAFDWPQKKLQIQLLDDSTDDTVEISRQAVEKLRREGFDASLRHRTDRTGFKAGALREGLEDARGKFIAVFDADFVPPPDFLRKTIPFFENPRVGIVQTRWGHLNENDCMLTRAQGIAIDGHFGIEQAARCWGNFFLNFNGTAGIWRRETIDDAGGWQDDTLTEDLDLSYRAQLAGWKVEYLPDVEVPAELPSDISAFRSQQRRWAKGSIQTAVKLLPRLLKAPLEFMVKLQAVLHLTHYFVHPLMVIVAVLMVPLLKWWYGLGLPYTIGMMVFFLVLSTCGPSALYVTGQKALRERWPGRLLRLPLLMVVGTGIAVSNSRAVLEALFGVKSGFIRTPKKGDSASGYRTPVDPVFVVELLLSLYTGYGLWLYLSGGKFWFSPFLFLYAAGFGFVAALSFREVFRRPLPLTPKGVKP